MNKLKKVVDADPQRSNPYLQYLSQFKELSHLPTDFSQLDNGVILIELFMLVKGFKLTAPYEQHPKTFSHQFSNLKILFLSIEGYWKQQLQSQIQADDIDIVEIGRYGSVPQLEKFLELFVKTAAKSQSNDIFIERILQTSQHTQQFLKRVIEKAINSHLTESPRKEKEKRMIDRLIELDHENEKLQQIVNTICEQKYQLEVLFSEKTKQIQNLRSDIDNLVFTPQKSGIFHIPDTSDRKENQIESLKLQILQISVHHQKQIQQCLAEIQKLSYKANSYDKVKGELELSQSIILSNQEVIAEAQKMESTLSQRKAELMNKENIIVIMREKLEKYQHRFIEMEKYQLQLKAELERKNIQLLQLASKLEKVSPKKVDVHHNLFLQFPPQINTEVDAYVQTNKRLREELERTRQTLQRTAAQLDQVRKGHEFLQKCDDENKKLKELIIEQKSYKGEEIDILVHALYHLRKKVKDREANEQRVLKTRNR